MGVGLFLFLFFNVSLNTFFLTLEHLKVDVLHNIMIELSDVEARLEKESTTFCVSYPNIA